MLKVFGKRKGEFNHYIMHMLIFLNQQCLTNFFLFLAEIYQIRTGMVGICVGMRSCYKGYLKKSDQLRLKLIKFVT